MQLYVNDTPVIIIERNSSINTSDYELRVDVSQLDVLNIKLKDDVLVTGASEKYIKSCLDAFSKQKVKKLDSITFAVEDVDLVVKFIKKQFRIIKAAGGLVVKDDKILLISRLGKWDLPKGKIEKNEKARSGAKREVEEECNIKVELDEKICHTWHTYTRNGKKILKKTQWYKMYSLDDAAMTPQLEENITEVKWMSEEEVMQALYNSYNSIREVIRTYYSIQKTLA